MGSLKVLYSGKSILERTIKNSKSTNILLILSFFVALFVFFKNAWISEDAYILFRSIEQLFAGNGPVWNPHERVQVFTSPLWFWVLSFGRLFSSDIYLITIMVSFLLWLFTIVILKQLFNNNKTLFIGVLLFSASTGFFDYTSSGLENSLAYFLISLYLFYYNKLFSSKKENVVDTHLKQEKHFVKIILFIFGLLICVRHDLVFLLLPSVIYILWRYQNFYTKKKWILVFFISFLPIIMWTLFALLYYGFPLPNTAYAKLNIDINRIAIIKQGLKYFLVSLKFDVITIIVICSTLFLSFKKFSKRNHFDYIAYGIALNLIYIIYVGGDFMLGRFMSYSYFASVLIMLLKDSKRFTIRSHYKYFLWIIIVLYLFAYPRTPFKTSLDYSYKKIHLGVANERGYYFKDQSLYRYILDKGKKKYFPIVNSAKNGCNFKENSSPISLKLYIGIFGYWAGTDKIIIDVLALSDPLLARMPVEKGEWRIGHFIRKIPKGYIESVYKNKELIAQKSVNEFYKKMKIITQGKVLFDKERIKVILLMNLGWYNYLLGR